MDLIIKTPPSAIELRLAETRMWTDRIMVSITSDTPLLYKVVAEGPDVWRHWFLTECAKADGGGLLVTEVTADRMFVYFCGKVREHFQAEQSLAGLQAMARRALDVLEEEKPLTDKDVIDSLEVDSASSDDARRMLYGRDGSPQQNLDILKDEMKQELDVSGNLR